MKIVTYKYDIVTDGGEIINNIFFPFYQVRKSTYIFGFNLIEEFVNRIRLTSFSEADEFLKSIIVK